MKKIPSVFKRNYLTDHLCRDEVVPGCEWVLAGEGVATEKFDGTSCLVRDGVLFKRYDAKQGKTPPAGWEPCEPSPDPKSGHWPGWLKVDASKPEDRWHIEGWTDFLAHREGPIVDGTYELVGPKVGGNPHELEQHLLWRHGQSLFPHFPRTFDGMKLALTVVSAEGIVFHHPNGRMAKVKTKDFGLRWPR